MIELENITKDYVSDKCCTKALKGVNLSISEGEFAAIMGKSGSGKSTLLNIIGAMDKPTQGVYRFASETVSGCSNSKLHNFRKKYISFVFQSFALMNRYTVYENVEMPLLARGVRGRKRTVNEKLEMMGIAELSKKYPTQLSGGQAQRCAIARALAADTPLILADEPTGSLDSVTAGGIMDIFKRLNGEGKTIIIVTHDIGIANRCDRIIEIVDGVIAT